jgi:hypothetical protein
MEPDGIETEKSGEYQEAQQFSQKGDCNKCDYYYNCPRMKGMGRCQNMGQEQSDASNAIEPHDARVD